MARKTQRSVYCHDALWEKVRLVSELTERSMAVTVERAMREYVAKKLGEPLPAVKEYDDE